MLPVSPASSKGRKSPSQGKNGTSSMPPLGINCLDSFLNFRNRKKPKSSKQKIPAFFIWTKLSLFLLSISHSSRFPFLLTPIPPLLPILHFPLLHLIPFSPTPLFLYSNTPHGSILKKWTHKVTIYYNKVDTKRRYLHVNKQQRYSL